MHKFRKLQVWQKSMLFVSYVYKITSQFPKQEIFGLIDQLRRAAVAIPLNIAEGSGCGSDKEFIRFLRIALRSLYEVIAGFEISLNLKYIKAEEYSVILNSTNELGAMMNGLINKLKMSKSK